MGCLTSGVLLLVIFIILDFGTKFFDYWVNLYGENIGCSVPALIIIFIWILFHKLINKLVYNIKRYKKNMQKYNLYVYEKDYSGIVSMHESGEYIDDYNYAVASANISSKELEIYPFCYMANIQKIENIMRTNNYYNNYNFEFLYNKGVCCFYLEKFSEAVKYFDEALALKEDPMVFFNRALCRFKLKDIPNALKDFQLALQDEKIVILPQVQEAKKFVDKIYGDI